MLQKLGTEKLIHSPPYRPQSNGRIEGFHRYLKACMAKYMRAGLEWTKLQRWQLQPTTTSQT